jgi:iron complex outermembrane receptor protein
MRLFFTLLLLLPGPLLPAQADTLPPLSIEPVTITATRLDAGPERVPYAVSVLEKSALQAVQQQLSVHDALMSVPGVFVQNPDNFAQDLRISIRGFGARAAFGIRGIRIITDGIPESTPDGQADVDNIDAGALQRMEILKGGSSALYGNASGGVIYLKTEEPPETPFAEVQTGQGSYGFQRYQLKAGFKRAFWSVGYNRSAGYRQHAGMAQLIVNNKWRFELAPETSLKFLFNYAYSPQADDPGGLTAEQVTAGRRQARPQNLEFDAGERVEQGRAGLVLDHRFDARQKLQARAFLTGRRFGNRLAFQNGGVVEINRLFGGGGLQYEWKHRLFGQPYRVLLGLDADRQRDYRRRFNNEAGLKGDQTFGQDEKFASFGAYSVHELQLGSRWSLTLSGRYDRLALAVADRFPADGDQSGRIPLKRFSPSAGLTLRLLPALHTYVNAASNFETPTLNELSANPANTGGFNPDLKPQKARSGEWGLRATAWKKLRIETALFLIDLTDEFVPYQLTEFPGRIFYKNAGKSRRKGLEAALHWTMNPRMAFSLNYTWSDFRYTEYRSGDQDFAGHRTPGIPPYQGFAEWRWASAGGFTAVAQVRRIGGFYANDANTVKNGAYTVAYLRAGYRRQFKSWSVEPFAGLSNLLNERYNGNVLLNAAGERFFEPAMGLNAYGGLKIYVSHPVEN